jgi:hypothetical protein
MMTPRTLLGILIVIIGDILLTWILSRFIHTKIGVIGGMVACGSILLWWLVDTRNDTERITDPPPSDQETPTELES